MFNDGMELQCGQKVNAGLSSQAWRATHLRRHTLWLHPAETSEDFSEVSF